MSISEKAENVLKGIINLGGGTATDIAKAMDVSVGSVTGAVTSLKKAGFVEVVDGVITATDEARFEYGDNTSTTPAVTSTAPAATAEVEAASTETIAETIAETAVAAENSAILEAELQSELAAEQAEQAEAATPAAPSAIAAFVTPPAAAPAVVKAPVENKAEKARAVFNANKEAPRKTLMALLMAPDVGLSKHGANTYIYNMRKAAGMVKPRTPAEAVAATAAPAATAATAAPAEGDNIVIEADTTTVATAAPAETKETETAE